MVIINLQLIFWFWQFAKNWNCVEMCLGIKDSEDPYLNLDFIISYYCNESILPSKAAIDITFKRFYRSYFQNLQSLYLIVSFIRCFLLAYI